MKHAEARALKVAVYGALSPVGQALMTELRSRDHEAIPLTVDFSALPPRPYPDVKTSHVFSAQKVSRNVAGMKAVIAVLDPPRASSDATPTLNDPTYLVDAVAALISGLRKVKVSQLLLVGDFSGLEDDGADPDWRLVCQKIHDRLDTSPLHWTLVSCPFPSNERIPQLAALSSRDLPHELLHFAAEVADMLERPGHSGQHLSLVH
ncbi:putative NADH-flavin reductase [Pseudomonas duriflava]|uniref:Putative NADH-flavin reductase n=1 Tax=Pseudomonas duriflava TaxID=459528 RepID=A0A562QLB3_9PSED|nr:NADH-flavin reductase [Pseudomonas duriflava]TWI57552.1 putative NADH-flavin reductase [Pseudomonas duriflava]